MVKALAPLLAACGLLLAACDAPAPAARQDSPAANAAASTPAGELPARTGRVVDGADLLGAPEEAQLTAELEALERRTTDQLFIVTTPSLRGRTIEAFGLALGNAWRIGQRDKDNGVLLIVAPAERKVRIEVGYGLEAVLTNARAAAIIGDMMPALRRGAWHEAIGTGSRAIIGMLVENEAQPRRGRP